MNLPKARVKNIVVQELKAETLIYDLITDKAYTLNETSSIVFSACGNNQTFEQLQTKYKYPTDLINLALDELHRENLLQGEHQSAFSNLSRREVIRKVGLATMVALPVIASLIAPKAAMAASGGNRAVGASCTASSQCASNTCATAGDAAGTCCTTGSTGRYARGYQVANGVAVSTCATFSCDTFNPTLANLCCSGSVELSSCTPDPRFAGFIQFQCSCT